MGYSVKAPASSLYARMALALLVGWTAIQLLVIAAGAITNTRDSDFYIGVNLAIGWLSFPIYAAGIVFLILWIVNKNRNHNS